MKWQDSLQQGDNEDMGKLNLRWTFLVLIQQSDPYRAELSLCSKIPASGSSMEISSLLSD